MSKSISLRGMTDSTARLIRRYHVVLFTILALGGLAVAISMLSQTILIADDTSPHTDSKQVYRFDEKTIEEISELRKSGEAGTKLEFKSGRNIPFIE